MAPSHDLHAMARITVEKGPMGITFIDAGTACVMNHDQGSISVVDVRRGVVIDRYETAAGPARDRHETASGRHPFSAGIYSPRLETL